MGILAPICWNFVGLSRNSLISSSSSTASSTPATSLKVIFGWSLVTTFALALPKDMTRLPPPCICCMRKKKIPMMIRNGRKLVRMPTQTDWFWGLTSWGTSGCWESRSSRREVDRKELWNLVPSESVPVMVSLLCSTTSLEISPRLSLALKSP